MPPDYPFGLIAGSQRESLHVSASRNLGLRVKPMKTQKALLSLGTSALAAAFPASAATWTSNATAGANWTVADHWSGDIAPIAGDSLAFNPPATGGTRTTNNDFAAGTSFANISFGGAAFVLNGNSIVLTGNITNSAGNPTGINLATELSSGNHLFSMATSTRIDFNGVISGTGSLEVVGPGSLRLQTNAKTYSGNTTVTSGTLDLNLANVLPSGTGKGDVTVTSGAFLGLRFGQNINGLSGGGSISAFSSGTKNINLGNNDANGSFSGSIANGSGAISLTKSGSGTQTLGGNSTYTGATTVSAGTLLVNGSLGTTAVTANGGTLGGTGTTGGNVTVNAANFAAGASAGSLEIAGNLNLTASSTTRIELGGTAFTLNGTEDYDRTKLTGATSALTLGSGTLSISLINGFALAGNQAFGILQLGDTASSSGTFSGLTSDGALVGNFGGVDLFITYSGSFGDSGTVALTGGNDIVLYTVPEPAAAALGGLGMLVLLRRRRA